MTGGDNSKGPRIPIRVCVRIGECGNDKKMPEETEGLRGPRGDTAGGSEARGARPTAERSDAGRACEAAKGDQREAAGGACRLPEHRSETARARGGRNKTRGAGAAPKARAGGAKQVRNFPVAALNNVLSGIGSICRQKLCAAGSGIFIPPPAPRRLVEPRRRPQGAGAIIMNN